MGFVKSFEEILASAKNSADFYDAEILTVFWETKPEIIEKLLPPPLEPAKKPIAFAFVANYPQTNFGVSYQESALFLRANFDGIEGGYCLAMPVTNDIAMAGGREVYGFPKKIGEIQIEKQGNIVTGWTQRHGIRFMEVRANLNGKFNVEDAQDIFLSEDMNADNSIESISYNFKYFPAPEGRNFDYSPRLVAQKTILKPNDMKLGEAEIVFQPSNNDPWDEIEVVRMLGAVYTIGNNSMLSGKVVAKVDPIGFAPYAFLKWDLS